MPFCQVCYMMDPQRLPDPPPVAGFGDVYSVLFRWRYKHPGVMDVESQQHIGRKIIERITAADWQPVHYAFTYWSSDRDGWWIFQGTDLRRFEEAIRDLRTQDNLDKYMDAEFEIGKYQPVKPYCVDSEPSAAGGFDVIARRLNYDETVAEEDSDTEFVFSIARGQERAQLQVVQEEQVMETPSEKNNGRLRTRVLKGEARVHLSAETGPVVVMVGLEGTRWGICVPLLTDEAQA